MTVTEFEFNILNSNGHYFDLILWDVDSTDSTVSSRYSMCMVFCPSTDL